MDEPAALTALLEAISDIAREIPMVFPCHPRTRKQINDFGLDNLFADPNWINPGFESGILLLEPLDYIDFLSLWKDCTAVLTDSGGLQEETTALKIPCLTMRENTERPITLEIGSNTLVGQDTDKLKAEIDKILKGEKREGAVPELWDGRASERIVSVLDS